MSAPPYMKLYVGDYLGDTHHLSALEHGAYLLLLMGMWRAGGKLPANDAKLARIARCTDKQWAEIREDVLAFFHRAGGSIKHRRLTLELGKYEDVVGKRKAASEKGVSEKRKKNSAKDQPNGERDADHLAAQPEPEPKPERRDRNPSLSTGEPARTRPSKRQPEEPIPDGFPGAPDQSLAEGWVAAAQVELNVGNQAKRFRNHAETKDRRERNWPAAWRAWIEFGIEDAPLAKAKDVPAPAAVWNGPADVMAIAEAAMTGAKARSYLSRCTWQEVPFRAVVAPNGFVADQINADAGKDLAAEGVQVLARDQVRAA